jgi:rare lipoprotein A (peptidoglycan hydrolase)
VLFRICACCLLALGLVGCSTEPPVAFRPEAPLRSSAIAPVSRRGSPHMTLASWYGPGFNGRSTSSGEAFDSHRLTAASPALPLGSYARVTNLENGQSAVVQINDRGPFVHGRGIDLSQGAADRLGFRREGLARVEVTRLDSTASSIPLEPERWTGSARVHRRYRRHHRHRGHSWVLARNPITTWVLELTR